MKDLHSSSVQSWITIGWKGHGAGLACGCVMQTTVQILRGGLQSCCVAVLCGSLQGAEPVAAKQPAGISRPVATAVLRALPFLWEEGERWIDERGCVSCHQVPLMVWSLSAAEDRGFPVEKKRLQRHKEWSVRPASFNGPDQKVPYQLESALKGNTDTMNMLLLGLGVNRNAGEKWKRVLLEALVNNQKANGFWGACGQLPAQKRPLEETNLVSSMWAVLALLRQNHDVPRVNLNSLMLQNTEAVSTECSVVRLLLSEYVAATSVQASVEELLRRQHADGGWGWISEQASDALATGLALYALRASGAGDGLAEALVAGDEFLLQTQLDDGSWRVPGTKRKAHNEPTETANYWGTAWAVVGLLEE